MVAALEATAWQQRWQEWFHMSIDVFQSMVCWTSMTVHMTCVTSLQCNTAARLHWLRKTYLVAAMTACVATSLTSLCCTNAADRI